MCFFSLSPHTFTFLLRYYSFWKCYFLFAVLFFFSAKGWFRGIFLLSKPISSPSALWILPTLLLICKDRVKLNKEFCLIKNFWGVLKWNQNGFALGLPQIFSCAAIRETEAVKPIFCENGCLNRLCILICFFIIWNLQR